MSKSTYRPARFCLAAVLLLVIALAAAAIAGALRARSLLMTTLDGSRQRIQTHTHLPEFALRAQMYSAQAASRVNGWRSVVSQEEVSCKSADGIMLIARTYAPIAGEADAPWALLLHGGQGTDGMQLIDVACELSLAGYHVLAPDTRAHGRSGGALTSLGICESRDVLTWVDFIKMRNPAADIVVFGQAEGAAAALLASGEMTGKICAIAADSAYASVRDRAAQMLEETRDRITAVDKGLFELAYKAAFGADMAQGNVLASVESCAVPLLFIHGTGDEDVPAWHGEDIAKAAGENAQLLLIEGAAHGMARFSQPDAYYGRLLAFFADATQ